MSHTTSRDAGIGLCVATTLPGTSRKSKAKGGERKAGKMSDECPDQGFSNMRGTTQPLPHHQASPRLAHEGTPPHPGIQSPSNSTASAPPLGSETGRAAWDGTFAWSWWKKEKEGPLATFQKPKFIQQKQLLFMLWSCSYYFFGDKTSSMQ